MEVDRWMFKDERGVHKIFLQNLCCLKYVFKSIGHVVLLPAIYILGQSSEYILHLNLIVVIDNQY